MGAVWVSFRGTSEPQLLAQLYSRSSHWRTLPYHTTDGSRASRDWIDRFSYLVYRSSIRTKGCDLRSSLHHTLPPPSPLLPHRISVYPCRSLLWTRQPRFPIFRKKSALEKRTSRWMHYGTCGSGISGNPCPPVCDGSGPSVWEELAWRPPNKNHFSHDIRSRFHRWRSHHDGISTPLFV